MPESGFVEVVEKTRALLKEHGEWRARYAGYAEEIGNNLSTIEGVRSTFREWSPLNVYLNMSSAKNAKHSVGFELRYMGQTVARLTANKDRKHRLSTTKKLSETNQRDFHCNICLSSADWGGRHARRFRSFFRTGPLRTDAKGNEEHCLQSMLLTEFSTGEDTTIRHIRPVTIGGVRFPMPTPISASDPKDVRYSKHHGGGIDILVRTGTGGRATRLCIMELKIKGGRRESKAAMKQAIAYATFIRELLRSHAGAAWWKLFGFGGEVPDQLELYAACAMRANEKNETSFGKTELKVDGDIIILHYLYFHLIDEGTNVRIRPGDTTLKII